jgi:D-glycero-D-manno-heptose 1,7-bisphosphate phosphatase
MNIPQAKPKAAFFDRDGVINDDTGHYYVFKPDDFILNPDVIVNMSRLHKAGYLIIVISNQGGISRGWFTKNDIDSVHDKFRKIMADQGIPVTEIYYCPHHNEFENCLCRKPNPLMVEKAIARFNIDIDKSFMIGDKQGDVDCAEKAGVKGYLIKKNTSFSDIISKVLSNG